MPSCFALRVSLVAVLLMGTPVLAAECARVWVRLDGPGWSGAWAAGVPAELATEISVSGLCEAPSPDQADAQIVLRFESATVVEMEVSAGVDRGSAKAG